MRITLADWAKSQDKLLKRQAEEYKAQLLAEGWLLCKGPKRRPYWRRGPHYKSWPEFTSIRTSIPTKQWRMLNVTKHSK